MMKRIHIQLTEEQHDTVLQLADLMNSSASAVIRQLLDKHFDDIERAIDRMHGGMFGSN